MHRPTPPRFCSFCLGCFTALLLSSFFAPPAIFGAETAPLAPGFRGVWYSLGPTGDEYHFKYSGGLGTFPHAVTPMAQYSPEAKKTYFTYGGAGENNRLQTVVSYYDHATRQVARPRILREYTTNDAHDTAALTIAPDGHVWIFSTVHGNDKARQAEVFRSDKPHSIDAWEKMDIPPELDDKHLLNYTQPWQVPGEGMLLLFTRYTKGRQRYFSVTRDNGKTWSPRVKLSELPGHYQVSWQKGARVASAFDRHPETHVDQRTDLYYTYTDDFGATWRNAAGDALKIPMTSPRNEALVHPYSDERLLVYVKDLKFDAEGNPAILYVTSPGHEPGPTNDPRKWHIAHWTGGAWKFIDVARSDHNYDHGAFWIEADGTWRVIGPTEPGPQPYHTGGEISMLTSGDQGASWSKALLTDRSKFNHSYVRAALDADPAFYAFWADGDPRQRSKSSLYFCSRDGSVFLLPRKMDTELATPELLAPPKFVKP